MCIMWIGHYGQLARAVIHINWSAFVLYLTSFKSEYQGRHMFELDIGHGRNDLFVDCISKLYRYDIELNCLEDVWTDGE